MPEPHLLRTFLLLRQGDATRPAFPVDHWPAAQDASAAAEARIAKFAKMREAIFEDANSNPQPLRLYGYDLMETYRAQRSVFYLPSTVELEQVLKRLLEADPQLQRIYKLYQAELAWDRGDDTQCLELGTVAFDPDPAKGGPVDFSRDPRAPRAVLYRMIETLWRTGHVREAGLLCKQAETGGYLADGGALFPLLEVTYRRVQASGSQTLN
jgi:hypothetical protein